MALSVEVAEVVEHFQWLTEDQSRNLPPEKLAEIREEIGDVMIYLPQASNDTYVRAELMRVSVSVVSDEVVSAS